MTTKLSDVEEEMLKAFPERMHDEVRLLLKDASPAFRATYFMRERESFGYERGFLRAKGTKE